MIIIRWIGFDVRVPYQDMRQRENAERQAMLHTTTLDFLTKTVEKKKATGSLDLDKLNNQKEMEHEKKRRQAKRD